jgi:hypothetical protein
MSCVIGRIAAQADTGQFDNGEEAKQPRNAAELGSSPRKPVQRAEIGDALPLAQPAELEGLPAHQFPGNSVRGADSGESIPVRNVPGAALLHTTVLQGTILPPTVLPSTVSVNDGDVPGEVAGLPGSADAIYEASAEQSADDDRERRMYRRRTVAMLRRYMKYSIETGRLPSVLGGEFFRAKVTSYTVVTFEDRVIFVHDMERCLDKLDEFSRQLIARHILQEHDREATARLLGCNEKTVRRLVPMALDQFSEILLDVGLMEPIAGIKKSCQEGERDESELSCWEDSENKF